MWKSLGLVIIAALSGAAMLAVIQKLNAEPEAIVDRTIAIESIPTLSGAAAEIARESSFIELNSIEDVLALPTDFTRREAVYVLAGRSDADRLQKLVFDADRISDRTLRDTFLSILFRRLAEVDPQTALALARVEPYSNDDGIENTIWRTWARNDLDEAIFAVKTQTSRRYQLDAAQSLYAAHGYMGNETTARIADELGIEQNRQTRLRYLRTLLEESPRSVAEFISQESSTLRRREYINWFVYALDTHDRSMALSLAESFGRTSDRMLYSSLVEDRFARLNPAATLQQALAANGNGLDSDAYSALQELASKDIDEAMNFYERISSPQQKMIAASIISIELAVTDPAAALAWVRSLDGVQSQRIESGLLAEIAQTDPEFAMNAAASLSGNNRNSAITSIVISVAGSHPDRAAELLTLLPEDGNKQQIQGQVAKVWLLSDPSAAIKWLTTLNNQEASKIAGDSTQYLARSQPDTAYKLLAFVNEPQRAVTAQALVSRFASVGEISRARSLIEEYKGHEGFEHIEANFIGGLARHDTESATQLALQLQDDKERSQALANITSIIVAADPAKAVSLLPNITDPANRERALRTIATRWYRNNPGAALNWVSTLPAGEERDTAAVNVTMSFKDIGQRELNFLESIQDTQSRINATKNVAIRLARTDQAAALRMIEGLEMPEDEKVKYREQIQNSQLSR